MLKKIFAISLLTLSLVFTPNISKAEDFGNVNVLGNLDVAGNATLSSLKNKTVLGTDANGKVIEGTISDKIQFTFVFDGGGSEIADNKTAWVRIPANCTITGWDLTGDVSGAIKIDVWVDTYANYPPTNADTITNAHEPEIVASGTKAQDLDITDWSDVTLDAGSYMKVSVDSCTTITYAVLTIYGVKS